MPLRRAIVWGSGIAVVLLVQAGCQVSFTPATPTPLAAFPSATANVIPSTRPISAFPTAIVTPIAVSTPASDLSMADLAGLIRQTSDQLGREKGGQVSASQMEQVMDETVVVARRMAPMAVEATQGTPETRQMMALTVDQMSLLAARLRDQAADLTFEQRTMALQEMQSVSADTAQVMSQLQDVTPQSSAADRQHLMGQMQELLVTMRSMTDRYGLASPPLLSTPGR